ncbi:SsgA family sporulation/cell division regulator [Streptomyces sp. NPDC055607]
MHEEDIYVYQGCLSYSSSDPFAVSLEFYLHDEVISRRVISRESLQEGLRCPNGIGDTIITPCEAGQQKLIAINFRNSVDSIQDFVIAARTVSRFLRRTYGLVPRGTERTRIDWDRLLTPFPPEEERG